MSIILQPRLRLEVPYIASRVRDLHDRLSMYFTISPLGKHPEPDNCNFRGRAGFNSYIYCNNMPSSIQNGSIEFSGSAIVFEVEARIMRDVCFFTKDGDCDHPVLQNEAVPPDFASCWLEASSNTVEDRLIWRRALLQLRQIALRADSAVHMDEFLMPTAAAASASDDVSPAALQIYWTPPDSLDLGALPVFSASHEHIPMASQDQIPFDKRVRVRFTLTLLPSHKASDGRPVIGARMLYMHTVD